MEEQASAEPKVRLELREAYAQFFSTWQDGKQVGNPVFQRGENGEVVMRWDNDHMLASSDGGKTWHEYRGRRLWPDDDSFGVFRVGDEWVSIRAGRAVRRSSDGGLTWSEPQPVAPAEDERYPKLNGPHVFSIEVTSKGRIIIPEDYLVGREGPDPDVLYVNVSDDGGRTWQRSDVIKPPDLLPDAPEGFGEPAAVELAHGRIWMVFRALYGHLWQCDSDDGGLTWSDPCSTGLASPLSNVRVERVPGTDSVVLFWDFAQPGASTDFSECPSCWWPRAPLVFAVSHDNCVSWSHPAVITAGTGLYPAIHFAGEEMVVVYMSNSDPAVAAGADYGLTLVVYDTQKVLNQPTWTRETIQPYIVEGRMAHWLAERCLRAAVAK
ncbi:sialidase family protein [Verrucomicrobiota bacterium]